MNRGELFFFHRIQQVPTFEYHLYLTFENHLNSVLSKMANATSSLYLVRNQIPSKVRIDVFKSVVLSHLSFSGVFLQTVTVKNINRINRQINWGIKFDHSIDLLIKDCILLAEN